MDNGIIDSLYSLAELFRVEPASRLETCRHKSKRSTYPPVKREPVWALQFFFRIRVDHLADP